METISRRLLLQTAGLGIGSLVLPMLLSDKQAQSAVASDDPLAPKRPHFPGKAKRIVHLFLSGGPSHLDLFDPKPELNKHDGQPHSQWKGVLFGSPFKFNRHGQSGVEFSELLSRVGQHADDLCLVRSMKTDVPAHPAASRMLATGHSQLPRPSFGAWITYGLGTECANMPAYVVLGKGGNAQITGSSFLPPVYQGTSLNVGKGEVMADLSSKVWKPEEQRLQLDVLSQLNRQFAETVSDRSALDARIRQFELAFQMQTAAPEAFALDNESEEVKSLYDLKSSFGRSLLAARRLLERGVRVIQIFEGGWDHHQDLVGKLPIKCRQLDGAVSAFLTDLKRTGLFEDTLFILAGEFGRTPVRQAGSEGESVGRDHNHLGFSVVLAGAGVQGGKVFGATDDFGREAVIDPVHVHDLHATLLHLLGFDHTDLTYRFSGRDYRLTDVYGRVVKEILS